MKTEKANIKYRVLVQNRQVAEGSMDEMAEKAKEWARLIVNVRVEPVAA